MTQTAKVLNLQPEVTPYLISYRGQKRSKVWIVLPAFNEEQNLGILIEKIAGTMTSENYSYEIVVVDDGSSDQTQGVAKSFCFQVPLTVLFHEKNQGLGATMRDGFKYVSERAAQSDIIVSMDADNPHNPGVVPAMLNSIMEGNDVVIASRYQNGSYIRGVSGFRQLLSLGASFLFRAFFPVRGVKDYTCGYRAYRAELIQKAFSHYGQEFINQNGFECMVDILIKLRKLEAIFREVPLVLRCDLKQGSSKMRVARTIFRSLSLIAKHRLLPSLTVF